MIIINTLLDNPGDLPTPRHPLCRSGLLSTSCNTHNQELEMTHSHNKPIVATPRLAPILSKQICQPPHRQIYIDMQLDIKTYQVREHIRRLYIRCSRRRRDRQHATRSSG